MTHSDTDYPSDSICLITPGLLGSAAMLDYAPILLGDTAFSAARLMSRANNSPCDARSLESILPQLFPNVAHDNGMAMAALRYIDDTGKVPPGYCLAADPVHLQIGRKDILMGPDTDVLPNPKTMADIGHLLEDALSQYHVTLEITQNNHGYLHLKQAPQARFAPLPPAAGQAIHTFMPSGAEGGIWRSVINACQMQLHHSPLDSQKTSRATVPINSLWFWGGGQLPPPPQSTPNWQWVISNDARIRGLARYCGIKNISADTDRFNPDITGQLPALFVLTHAQDPVAINDAQAWANILHHLDKTWFAPLLLSLQQGAFRQLEFLPLSGQRYGLTRQATKRWWRRDTPLSSYILLQNS